MLMCSFVHFYFVCEHLFTFQFCALMPKISKENFAKFSCILKILSRNTFLEPQPDSASYIVLLDIVRG